MDFDFLSVVFTGAPIFSQTNFALAYIKSFNSVMSFVGIFVVGIFVNKFFSFSVRTLTAPESYFLRECSAVFFLYTILLMISIFIFSSGVNVCVFVLAVYRSLSCRIWFGVSGFPVFNTFVTVLGVCWCVTYILFIWFPVFQRQKTNPFFIIVLTWSETFRFVVLNLTNSVKDSINFFSISSFCSVTPKISVQCYFVIFPCQFSTSWSLFWVFNLFIVSVPERWNICVPGRRKINISRMPIIPPWWLSGELPADYDTQTCCLGPMLNFVPIYHFSWIVYCGYTRYRGCLLSARLTHM